MTENRAVIVRHRIAQTGNIRSDIAQFAIDLSKPIIVPRHRLRNLEQQLINRGKIDTITLAHREDPLGAGYPLYCRMVSPSLTSVRYISPSGAT